MSAIDGLVAELCRDGVEYRKLGEVAKIVKGETPIQKAIPGDYPLVVTAHGRLSSNKFQFDCEAVCIPLVSSKGHGRAELKEVHYQSGKFALGNILAAVIPNDGTILQANFLQKYLMARKDTLLCPLMRGGANVSIPIDRLKLVKIPVPPIEVQREVVRILDAFTALTDKLTEELDCRRQQYAYYRDRLLSPESLEALDGKPVEMVRLGDVGQMAMCKRIFKSQTGKEGDIPFFKIGTFGGIPDAYINRELYEEYRGKYRFPKVGDILISASGTIGRTVTYHGEDAYFQDSNIVWLEHDESRVLNTYLKYMYSTLEWKVDGGTIKRLYGSAFHAVEIPVPSLATQQKVVDILDRFDALTASLTDGLPAEIEARKAQYAYYRDCLLDFPRKGGAAA